MRPGSVRDTVRGERQRELPPIALGAGALAVLPLAPGRRIIVHLLPGELAAAASLVEEVETVNEATGTPHALRRLALAAWRGREGDAAELIETSLGEAVARSEGIGLNVTHWASAVLYNGLGRYADALAAPQRGRSVPRGEGGDGTKVERKGSHAAFIALMSATPAPIATPRGRMAERRA